MKRTVILTVNIAENVKPFVKPENIDIYVRDSIVEAVEHAKNARLQPRSLLTGLTVTVDHVFEPEPECICNGGPQGEGMVSLPHESHCPCHPSNR